MSLEQGTGLSAHWLDYSWVYLFAFMVGFGTTVAEPALLAVALKAHEVSGGAIHVWGLRVAVALGVAVGVALGCFRIVTGTPLHWYIIAGYLIVVIQTAFSPRLIVPLAYDSGRRLYVYRHRPAGGRLGIGASRACPGAKPVAGRLRAHCLCLLISHHECACPMRN